MTDVAGGEMADRGLVTLASDHIELLWDPTTGVVEMRFIRAGFGTTAEDAVWLIDQLERLARSTAMRLKFLVDCRGLENTDPGWRTTLADFFRTSDVHPCIAWFNTSRLIRVTVEMFAVATLGIEGKAFDTEAGARAWLRAKGAG